MEEKVNSCNQSDLEEYILESKKNGSNKNLKHIVVDYMKEQNWEKTSQSIIEIIKDRNTQYNKVRYLESELLINQLQINILVEHLCKHVTTPESKKILQELSQARVNQNNINDKEDTIIREKVQKIRESWYN